MPKKLYTLENLDCANCAAKIEAKFNAHPQVEAAVITFAIHQLQLTAGDPDALIPELQALARTVEDQVVIHPWDNGHHHAEHPREGCCCHDHDHRHEGHCRDHAHPHHREHHHEHGEKSDLPWILTGAGLFVIALVLNALLPGLWVHIPVFAAAYLILGWEIILAAGKGLVKGHALDENFLMSVAGIGAFLMGDFAEGVGILLFYRIGEFFEEKAVARSRSRIMEAVDLRPEVVNLVSGETAPAAAAKPGDLLLVRPGDRIPLDSTVLEGESRIDTSPITGEPVPVAVKPGDPVTSGCVNAEGRLVIRVEKPLSESMVTRILDSVENAAAGKPKIDRFITRFARIYTPIVVAAAVAVAVVPSLLTGDWRYWIYTALSFLVMSCPCALVLSVPLAFFSGIGAGSKKGILFKGGLSIEALAEVKAVAMDKTGTITRGDFKVQSVDGDMEMLRLCAGCESGSTHPVAVSITAAARERGLTCPAPEELEEIPGHGIRGLAEGRQVLCGNERLMRQFGIAVPEQPVGAATVVYVAIDGAYAGSIRISDTLKEDAADAVQQLRKQGIATAMLTGDVAASAEAVAAEVGIGTVCARLLPEEKLTALQALRETHGPVMFVGDGINDAPVLAGADVGAAMGSGADAAIEAADVVFMTSRTAAIPQALDIARKTRRVAWQNVVFALAVKLLVMILGLFGYASMWAAVFADSGVAMLCVLNSIRLLYRKD